MADAISEAADPDGGSLADAWPLGNAQRAARATSGRSEKTDWKAFQG
jgi:hypothetical protein